MTIRTRQHDFSQLPQLSARPPLGSPCYRPEAIAARSVRWYGTVDQATSVTGWMVSVGALLAVIAFAVFGLRARYTPHVHVAGLILANSSGRPSGQLLFAELNVPDEAARVLRNHQELLLRLPAFPRFGGTSARGFVTSIERKRAADFARAAVRVELTTAAVEFNGTARHIEPGMVVESEIPLEPQPLVGQLASFWKR